ncbi:Uncharacterised protein [[Clostridium] sordellii]|uniref:hypothetical protein n=1 Tax=Paraclostridium sordellii TaxID=1505 RepID=UPI0005E6340E|nr:hypothetical protein [Paeniclostridium sordellii]CEN25495.1 Uncharacterised protein [[Clostridium] sordellii] [Paeniclostridium sordellii]
MKNNNLKKQKKIYFLIVSVFIFTGTIFLYSKFYTTPKSNKNDRLIVKSNDGLIVKSNVSSKENSNDFNNTEQENLKNIVKEFINTYYSYDANNPQINITNSQKFLTDDFYKELISVDDENTKVPTYVYRKVTNVKLTNAEKEGKIFRYTALVESDLLDENNKKISKLEVEFCIDLTKVNDTWKIPYFTLTGTGIQKYE